MRIIPALVLVLGACGSSKSPLSPSIEVTRLNIDQTCFSAGPASCTLTMTATYSNGDTSLSSPYSLVIAEAEGAAPAACDGSSKSGGAISVAQFQNLKTTTAYGFRGCIFDGTKYSAGYTQTFTTGTP